MSGIVIIGYQGVGKSTWADRDHGIVDLESSSFYVDGVRPEGWQVAYCNVAQHLAEQDFVVFVSSHQVVRDELARREGLRVAAIAPVPELKDFWIRRLRSRYESDPTDKNYKALANAEARYVENVGEILGDTRFETIPIRDESYSLLGIVRELVTEEPHDRH